MDLRFFALASVGLATPSLATPTVRGRYLRAGAVEVRGAGFAANEKLMVDVDVAWRHASVACHEPRHRDVRADRLGRFTIVVISRDPECAFRCDRYLAYVARTTAAEDWITSKLFACSRAVRDPFIEPPRPDEH